MCKRTFGPLLILVILCSSAVAADLDSLLTVQRSRAGERAAEIFCVVDEPTAHGLTRTEARDLRFLVAYLPLSDLASVSCLELLDNARLARRAKSEMAWGSQVNENLFRHFVLPHRVSQEPCVPGWRRMFFEEIAPRVKRMGMTEAALEVNHWAHEKATYQPSDSRDQDPLTTLRAGLGRCEEEMILAICALRSVGIPARQCYTPYWAHTDDNHAWVEAWADGQWHYFGACEPEPVLDRGWFTDAAKRTMLVVSQAYGDYRGDESVLKRYGRSTLINSTAVYGSTRKLEVTVEDASGKPVTGAKVVFNLFNYGAIMPALSLETPAEGRVSLTCGPGDWIVTAGQDRVGAIAHVRATDKRVVLKLDSLSAMRSLTALNYTPPPETPASSGVAQDSLFRCRLVSEDSTRESLWNTWAREAHVTVPQEPLRPDSLSCVQFGASCGVDGGKLYEILMGARGNWGTLWHFLTGRYPGEEAAASNSLVSDEVHERFLLLERLTDKDRRDFSEDLLRDHFEHTTLQWSLSSPGAETRLAEMDSTARERYLDYVVAPRIRYEPSRPWRGALAEFFSHHEELATSNGDSALTAWLRSEIVVEKERDRLGPPLTPVQTLSLRRGAKDDLELFYAALCRMRGIPARFNPASGALERWDNDAWKMVVIVPEEKGETAAPQTGFLTVHVEDGDSVADSALYYRDWAVQKWEKDHFSDVDFGFHTPFSQIMWPQELPTGWYCLTSGLRSKDGSAPLSLTWFELEPGRSIDLTLTFRSP